MGITKYGYDVFFTVTALCLILIVVALVFIEPKGVKFGVIGLSVLLFAFTANFFRDPERSTPKGEKLVISPADGKVIVVKQAVEPEYFQGETTMISIFMSPVNVHVNRSPITGTVQHYRYVKGEYFAAFEDKASEKNEQTIIGMEGEHGKVLFKQIAGFIARRIVCNLKPGDSTTAGERFGMIKFGSRVDVFVPTSVAVNVKVGDITVAGETVLAEYR
ncbi:MAG: phosphatidylserine decarboxylase family protein [Ignavibacteriae bacterium]|nr:phosphatidylserine decarboxylase family protein [Ignavibacteriota bacterium]